MMVPALIGVACFIIIEWPAALTLAGLPPRYVMVPFEVTTMAMPSVISGVMDCADAAHANANERAAATSVDFSVNMSVPFCSERHLPDGTITLERPADHALTRVLKRGSIVRHKRARALHQIASGP